LKKTQKDREDEKEDISICWMTLLEIERGGTRLHSVDNTLGTGYGSAVKQTTWWGQ
jgi:hypothetical protein